MEKLFNENGEYSGYEEIHSVENSGVFSNSMTTSSYPLVPLPSLEELCVIPMDFLISHVKNSGEANTIFEIGCVSAEMDAIYHSILSQLYDRYRLQKKHVQWTNNTLKKTIDDYYTAPYVSILDQGIIVMEKNLIELTILLHEKWKEMHHLSKSIQRYMEINNSTAQELLQAGCEPLSIQKSLIAKMEKTLYMRLEELYLKQTISLNSLQVIDGKYCCWETEMDENNPHAIKTSSELHDLEIAISPILPPSPSQPNQTNITDETVIDMSGNPLADESRMEASETSFTQNPSPPNTPVSFENKENSASQHSTVAEKGSSQDASDTMCSHKDSSSTHGERSSPPSLQSSSSNNHIAGDNHNHTPSPAL